jgi:hypothetical protein
VVPVEMKIVSVIGCGPSAASCGAATAPGIVLAVNDAALHFPHDAIVSMDGRWAVNRVPHFLGKGNLRTLCMNDIWLRDRAWAKLGIAQKPDYVHTFEVDTKSDVLGHGDRLVGLHSGAVGVNLARTMSPDLIYLYGFDAAFGKDGKHHFFGDYPWKDETETRLSRRKFRSWATQMEKFAVQLKAAGIRVVNTNKNSEYRCFEFGRPT